MSRVDEIRERTKEDLIFKTEKFGHCVLVRNTGFGKTWILSELIARYRKVLYLYPTEVIKSTALHRYSHLEEDYFNGQFRETFKAVALSETGKPVGIDNVTFMTYNKLARLTDKELKECEGYDLIISDECHRLGAKNTRVAYEKLMNYCKDSYFIGATATPDRSDTFDVVEEFFDDIVVFEYTLHDAFKDGMLKKPYYCYCTYDILGTLRKDLKKQAIDMKDSAIDEIISGHLIEIANIFNMDNIIRDVCTNYARTTNYMKFIIFFSNFKHIADKGTDVMNWFQKAFPNHTVNQLIITSEKKKYAENVNKLDDLVETDKTIDLIFCVDMLNMGYHVSDLTGILMYRGTESNIIYTQQLGRALNSGSEDACIVFDVVDNLHRKAVYDLYDKKVDVRRVRKSPMKDADKDKIDVEGLTDTEFESLDSSLKGTLDIGDVKWWKYCNRIRKEDLVAIGNEATYKELIAKLVAEPKVQRCRVAFERFFKRWCKEHGIPYPISKSELEEILKADKEMFIDYITSVRDKYKMDFKLERQWLLDERVASLSLEDYAKAFDVSIDGILNELGLGKVA